MTKVSASTLQTELTVKDRKQNVVFYRASQATYLYSIAPEKTNFYQVMCIYNLAPAPVSLFIMEKVGHRAGDQDDLISKNSKVPFQRTVAEMERNVFAINVNII